MRRQQCSFCKLSPAVQLKVATATSVICDGPHWETESFIPSWARSVAVLCKRALGNFPSCWEVSLLICGRKNSSELASWWWVLLALWGPREVSSAWYHEGIKGGETLVTSSSSPASTFLSWLLSCPQFSTLSTLLFSIFPLSRLSLPPLPHCGRCSERRVMFGGYLGQLSFHILLTQPGDAASQLFYINHLNTRFKKHQVLLWLVPGLSDQSQKSRERSEKSRASAFQFCAFGFLKDSLLAFCPFPMAGVWEDSGELLFLAPKPWGVATILTLLSFFLPSVPILSLLIILSV